MAAIETTTDPYVVAALRLLLLTGMRRGEVLGLRWCEVDLAAGVIHLANSKTGPRDVYLPRQAGALLEALPVMDGNPYIFLGRRPGQQLTNLTDAWHRIRRDLGLPDVRVHDLRHTVASLLYRSAPMIVVRDALGHRELETTNGYSHTAADDAPERLGGTGRDRYRTVVMNDGFETPDGWKAIDDWLDGPFFERLESDGEVSLSLAARKHIAQKIFHFTQMSIYYSRPELRAREQERSEIAEHAKALTELLDLNPDFVKFAREVMGLIDLGGPLKQLATAVHSMPMG